MQEAAPRTKDRPTGQGRKTEVPETTEELLESDTKQHDFYSGDFPEIIAPEKPNNFQELSPDKRSRIENAQLLYEEMTKQMERLQVVQEVFEQHGVPLVITRSRALYLWALSLNQGGLIPVADKLNRRDVLKDFFADIDYLVPVEMFNEVDAAIEELVERGLITVTSKEASKEKIHKRGLKSSIFLEATLLGQKADELDIKIDFFGGFGGYVGKDDQRDYKTLNVITVGYMDEEGNIVPDYDKDDETEYTEQVCLLNVVDDEAVYETNANLRKGNIGGTNFYYLVGKKLLDTYELESENVGLTSADKNKAIAIKYKLRLAERFLGIEKEQEQNFTPQ